MVNCKNHNSIAFLTTLGVYLGLVLVGSAPQILAQQTATIKYHRTLPSDDLYANSVIKLVNELNRLSTKRKFDWDKAAKFSIEDVSFDRPDDLPSFIGFGSLGSEVQFVIENAGLDIARRIFSRKADLGVGDFYSNWPETVDFIFLSGKDGLRLETSVNTDSEKAAQILGNSFAAYLTDISSRPHFRAQKLVAENTKSKVEDSHVLLVTHLPRAGLDSLLAKDVK